MRVSVDKFTIYVLNHSATNIRSTVLLTATSFGVSLTRRANVDVPRNMLVTSASYLEQLMFNLGYNVT